ncbi:MAG TPA: ABC transporter substrate-binding protein [Candidatus Paceibacterota bacterium]
MQTNKTIGVMAVIVIVFVGIVIARTHTKRSPGVIPIGGAFALTGDVAVYGASDRDGAQMAVDDINAAGGINGTKLQLLIEDTKSTPKDTVTAFTKLQSVDGAQYFIVSFLDSYPGAESLVKNNELLISPDAAVEAMNGTVAHPNVFGTFYRTQPKSELAIKQMIATGKKRLYIVANNDAYYTSAVGYMKEAAQRLGLQIVGIDMLGSSATAKDFLPKIKASGADAVFFSVLDKKIYVDFLQHKDQFIKGVSFYTDEGATAYLTPEYVRYMEGALFYTNVDAPKSFLDAFKAKFGHDPEITASVSYDSIKIMAQVMKDAPADISGYMRSRTFDTMSYGRVTFDSLGGIQTDTKYFVMKQITNGVPVVVYQ